MALSDTVGASLEDVDRGRASFETGVADGAADQPRLSDDVRSCGRGAILNHQGEINSAIIEKANCSHRETQTIANNERKG